MFNLKSLQGTVKIWGLGVDQGREAESVLYVLALILLSVLSMFFLFMGSFVPVGLLLGPLLYGFINNSSYTSLLPHALPAVILCGLQFVNSRFFFFSEFQLVCMLVIVFSLCFYSILAIIAINDSKEGNYVFRKLRNELIILYLLTALFCSLMAFEKIMKIEVGFQSRTLIYITSLVGILCNVSYLISLRKLLISKMPKSEISTEAKNSSLVTLQMLRYDEKIKKAFQEKEFFLNSNLTLEKLSIELDIPKHHLTKYFNHYLHTNFFNFIAAYRINYAIEKIEESSLFTIESLAHECGFNSKTSFVKYFKKHTGVVPSHYVNSLQVNI